MFDAIVPAEIFVLFMVFVRVGAAMMLVPGFGEVSVPRTIRLAFAVALTAVIGPVVAAEIPALPSSPIELLMIMAGEVAVGLLIGAAARLTTSGLQVAGTVIAFQSALGYAQTVDPSQGTQGAIVSAFFGLLGIILIFVSNLHHLIIRAIHDSYSLFQPGALPPVEGFAEIAVDTVAGSFLVGMIAAPFIVYGLVFYTGARSAGAVDAAVPVLLHRHASADHDFALHFDGVGRGGNDVVPQLLLGQHVPLPRVGIGDG